MVEGKERIDRDLDNVYSFTTMAFAEGAHGEEIADVRFDQQLRTVVTLQPWGKYNRRLFRSLIVNDAVERQSF
jgi:hypothetical protein